MSALRSLCPVPAASVLLIVLAASLFASAPGVALADEGALRTWTDSKGKFKIKAKMVSLEDGVVTLEKEDGTQIEIELEKLSPADRKIATEAAHDDADNPFKKKGDDPFKPKAKAKNDAKGKAGGKKANASDRGAAPRQVKVDWSRAKKISLDTPSAWQVEIGGETERAGFKPQSAPLPNKSGFFEKIHGIAVNVNAKKAAVGFVLGEPKPTGTSRVVICDLTTGKTTPPAVDASQMSPLALHDDGIQIVMRREEFGFGNLDRLEVWTVDGTEVSKSAIWTPYGDDQGAARDVLWAEFVDDATLATSSREGKVVLWKFPEIEPLCTFVLANGAVPALSPDRKLIAWSNGSNIGLFDVARREIIARQQLPEKLQWPYLAFSPSGRKLACVATDKILEWDVATGTLERLIPAAGLSIHGGIDFPAEGFLLANGKYLVDLENQLKLWSYEGQDETRAAGGWTFFATFEGDKNPGSLVVAHLPHHGAMELLKKSLTDPNLFVVKAGTTVKLNVAGIPDQSQQGMVRSALVKQLAAIGCQEGAAGSVELVAMVEGPKERTVSFHRAGDFKVQEYISRVRFVFQGATAWEKFSSSVPGVLMLKSGENVGSVLRDREKPNYSFFENVEFPKFVQKPAAGNGPGRSPTLGKSRVGTKGIQ